MSNEDWDALADKALIALCLACLILYMVWVTPT